MTVLQHGRTPLDDLSPTITIRNGDATKTFNAEPTGKPGVYRAAVVFPSAGEWNYEVNDGFITGQPHTYPPVQIGAPASAPRPAAATTSDDGGPSLGWLAIPGSRCCSRPSGCSSGTGRGATHHQPQAA